MRVSGQDQSDHGYGDIQMCVVQENLDLTPGLYKKAILCMETGQVIRSL